MPPPTAKRRVVVTGLGLVTPVGNTAADTWNAVLAGQSGAGPITLFDAEKFAVRFAHEVKDFNPPDYFDAHECRRTDRFTHFSVAAARMAIEDSGIDFAQCDRPRCGCVFGSGIGGILSMEEQYRRCLTGVR